MRNTRKGFTLVELLVVIAIIAILGTVVVVGFTGCIEQAKLSADAQVAEQMNTALGAGSVTDKPETFGDVLTLLTDNGFELKNFKTTAKGFSFYWNAENNIIVLYNAEKKEVAYPAGFAEFDPATSTNINDVLASKVLVGGNTYNDIFEAVEAAPAGATLHLLSDIAYTGAKSIDVAKDLTINGHGHAFTTEGHRGIKVTAGEVDLVINDLSVIVLGKGNEGRALQVSANNNNVSITANNSKFVAEKYTIHLMHDSENVTLTLNDCFSYGYTALYVKSYNSNITINDSVLSSNNPYNENPNNAFATISIQGSYSPAEVTGFTNGMGTNNTVVINNSTIEVNAMVNDQFALETTSFAQGNKVTITNTTVQGTYLIAGENTVIVDGVEQ